MGKEKIPKSLILLKDTKDAMKAEQVLKINKYSVKVVAPPPDVRVGCDLSIEINYFDSFEAQQLLKNYKINPLKIISLNNTELEPSEIVQETDFGDYWMVKAGHMKLTFNKKSGEIVNISGGGCPDIPYLALSMVGKTLENTSKPEVLGYTLCAYMLQKALDRALAVYRK